MAAFRWLLCGGKLEPLIEPLYDSLCVRADRQTYQTIDYRKFIKNNALGDYWWRPFVELFRKMLLDPSAEIIVLFQAIRLGVVPMVLAYKAR